MIYRKLFCIGKIIFFSIIIMNETLLKPKRQMSVKQMEALKKGREKRHQQMRTPVNLPNKVVAELIDTEIQPVDIEDEMVTVKPRKKRQPIDIEDDGSWENIFFKEVKEKEHQIKMRELELKMSRMESEYKPKKEEPNEEPSEEPQSTRSETSLTGLKEEPQFIFRGRKNI